MLSVRSAHATRKNILKHLQKTSNRCIPHHRLEHSNTLLVLVSSTRGPWMTSLPTTLLYLPRITENVIKQKCIPVGCVPSAAVAVYWECVGQGCVPGAGGVPKGRGVYQTPTCGQNDRYVWEHYLAATTFLTVVSVKQILATSLHR